MSTKTFTPFTQNRPCIIRVAKVGEMLSKAAVNATTLDFKLHVYDMTAPPTKPNIPRQASSRINALRWNETGGENVTTMKVIKTIQGQLGRWTITDSHLSPDNQR